MFPQWEILSLMERFTNWRNVRRMSQMKLKIIKLIEIGDIVLLDEVLAIIETEKVKVDIRSGETGKLTNFFAKEGDTVEVAKPLYEIDDSFKAAPKQVYTLLMVFLILLSRKHLR